MNPMGARINGAKAKGERSATRSEWPWHELTAQFLATEFEKRRIRDLFNGIEIYIN